MQGTLVIDSHDPPPTVHPHTSGGGISIGWGPGVMLHMHRPLEELEQLVADLDRAVMAIRAARVLGGQPSLYTDCPGSDMPAEAAP